MTQHAMETINLDQLCISSRERIVAAEPTDRGLLCYCRTQDGQLTQELLPFQPFLIVNNELPLETLPEPAQKIPLQGVGFHNLILTFSNAKELKEAEKAVKKIFYSGPTVPYRLFSDLHAQAFMQNSLRLFRNMTFPELHRLQIDIETFTAEGFDFPNAERDSDEVIMISLRDSTGWETCLCGTDLSEKELLQTMIQLINERDPDVIEGHNLFNFDLPYLEKRAARYRLKLTLGRDGSVIKKRPSRYTYGENTANYTRYDIFGRHVIDTLHLVRLYDVSYRGLESHGLKTAARHFGIASPHRVYVPGNEISNTYLNDPEQLKTYALDDVRETDGLSRILLPGYFYQTQLTPLTLQNCVVRGNASRIDLILVADYLRRQTALPLPSSARTYQGGLTDSFEAGIFENVWHMDIQSLYPSIIVANQFTPKADELGIFLHYLTTLRQFRLQAKHAAKTAKGEEQELLSALQKTFKILINSFYGYTGFAQGTFNDYDLAENITAIGRDLLKTMQQALQAEGAKILEMDTDGIYFVPPENSEEMPLLQKIQATLPQGIDVDLDNTYSAMFCYKSKNYALKKHDGSIAITGAALRSRGYEPFLRDLIRTLLELLLTCQFSAIPSYLDELKHKISTHQIPLDQLAKRENLPSSIEAYQKNMQEGKGRRSAVMELAIRTGRNYRVDDQLSYYVTGTKKNVVIADNCKLLKENHEERDENIKFYLEKVKNIEEKFAPFFNSSPTLF